MKEISTPVKKSSVSKNVIGKEMPGRRALDFVRQFARVYQATPIAAMPGVVLN